jgi:hypothetical protein
MTSVEPSKFALGIHSGRQDFTPQEAYDHVKLPIEEVERYLKLKPAYEALRKSTLQKLDGVVEDYNLQVGQPLNSKTSEAGGIMADTVLTYEGRICRMIVWASWNPHLTKSTD